MTQLININDLKLLKYIQLKDCNDFKFKNILLVINENEFRQLSQDDICKILAINCLQIYIGYLFQEIMLQNLEYETDVLIEKLV